MENEKQKLIQQWYDGEITYKELEEMRHLSNEEETYELSQVIQSAMDWIDEILIKHPNL